jgi:nucleoid DNA-binding protein
MNKAGIVEVIQGVLGGTKVQAEQVVDTVFDTIVKTLKKGDEVSIAVLVYSL